MQHTACALDCYDGCAIVCDNHKISGDKEHPFTQGSLCANVNTNIQKASRITTPMINGKAVSMKEALEYVAKIEECDFGISEYDFTKELFRLKGFNGLDSEEHYLNFWLDQCDQKGKMVVSEFGKIKLKVKNSKDIRVDCVKITANTFNVNKLTPSTISNEGHSACYGEVKVSLSKVVV